MRAFSFTVACAMPCRAISDISNVVWFIFLPDSLFRISICLSIRQEMDHDDDLNVALVCIMLYICTSLKPLQQSKESAE